MDRLPRTRDKRTPSHRDVSLVLGPARSRSRDIRVRVLPFVDLSLALSEHFVQLFSVGNVLVGVEGPTNFNSLVAVGVELERRVKRSSKRLAEQQGHPLGIGLGEGEDGRGHEVNMLGFFSNQWPVIGSRARP